MPEMDGERTTRVRVVRRGTKVVQRAPVPPGAAGGAESSLGLRRFLNENRTLLQTLSLLLAGAGFLRASREDDTVALPIYLTLVMAMVTFVRLWADLPRTMVILSGDNWTTGLVLFYYCFTTALVVGVGYPVWGVLMTQRQKYLWVAFGSLLGLIALTLLTSGAHELRRRRSALADAIPGLDERSRPTLVRALLLALVILVFPAAYYLGHLGADLASGWLDGALGTGGSAPGSPAR